jgi:hypothetical protein
MTWRYSLSDLTKALRRPSLFYFELQNLLVNLNIRYQQAAIDYTGFNPVKADWDNLLILDACRYDMFEEINHLNGNLKKVTSPGSESWEFLSHCFDGRELHDTIYITANPHAEKLMQGTFFAIFNLLNDAWDTNLETVPPGAVVEETKRVADTYPDKKLIIHFMQPHFPFIGDQGKEINHSGINPAAADDGADWDANNVWSQLRYGRADRDRAWTAYCENLELVFPHVERLATYLSGKTVVTSDHGNMVGERTGPLPVRAFGHLRGLRAPELNDVPWLELPYEQRRKVTSDPPLEQVQMDSEVLKDRLESLGYR